MIGMVCSFCTELIEVEDDDFVLFELNPHRTHHDDLEVRD